MIKRWLPAIPAVGLVGLVIALPPAALGHSQARARALANSVTFPDSPPPADPNAPDITSVVVSNNDSGLITFQINLSNRPALTADMLVQIFLDTDQNPNTGDPNALGSDYVIQYVPGSVGMFMWNGSNYINAPLQSTLISSYTAGGPVIEINASDLGNTTGFNFAAAVSSGITFDSTGNPDFTNAKTDVGPDPGHGFWNYQVKITPPPPPPPPVAPKFVLTPAGVPRAGQRFAVAASVNQGGGLTAAPDRLTCTARAGTTSVKTAVRRTAGRRTCTLTVPKGSKGKTLTMLLKLKYKSTSASRTFSLKIR